VRADASPGEADGAVATPSVDARGPAPVEGPDAGARLDPDVDAGLVERARRGDADAFERLVRRHLAAARAAAERRLGPGHADDVDDVVQDAFVRALERIEQCREPRAFRAWLNTIVRTTALNHIERRRVRATEPLAAVRDLASGADAGRRAERTELGERLRTALAGLSRLQRDVLLLHDYEGWSHGEIAERLGISAGSSRVHLHLARRAMRGRLAQWYGEGGST